MVIPVSFSPSRIEAYYILAENSLMAGELDRAIEEIQRAISLNDRYGNSYWELTKT